MYCNGGGVVFVFSVPARYILNQIYGKAFLPVIVPT